MNFKTFCSDIFKQSLLSLVIGIPIILIVLTIISSRDNLGFFWWLILWGFFTLISLTFVLVFPTVIAPLFNKFSPLEDGILKTKLDTLLLKCDFSAKGLFLMDGSKRSSHGNAFFAGFGKSRRIVLFDTLVDKLSENEIEAVLAHELGHYKCGHVPIRFIISLSTSLLFFGLFGLLIGSENFYLGLGIQQNVLQYISDTVFIDATFFILFFFVIQSITFPFQPITSIISRKHEFEADRYAAKKSNSSYLISALVKLYRDNASPVITDKWYSLFNDSHPTASLRIKALVEN
jgi:STE24 endopeptidase